MKIILFHINMKEFRFEVVLKYFKGGVKKIGIHINRIIEEKMFLLFSSKFEKISRAIVFNIHNY